MHNQRFIWNHCIASIRSNSTSTTSSVLATCNDGDCWQVLPVNYVNCTHIMSPFRPHSTRTVYSLLLHFPPSLFIRVNLLLHNQSEPSIFASFVFLVVMGTLSLSWFLRWTRYASLWLGVWMTDMRHAKKHFYPKHTLTQWVGQIHTNPRTTTTKKKCEIIKIKSERKNDEKKMWIQSKGRFRVNGNVKCECLFLEMACRAQTSALTIDAWDGHLANLAVVAK